jgi:general secretion pathway protein K
MKARRGVALLAALWLVVGIAAVAAQFSLDAHERRTLGIEASERGQQRALADGAFALMRAKLEYALRQSPDPNNSMYGVARRSDPWLDIDSVYSGPILVDSVQVDVQAHDLGTQLNVNLANEAQLRTFFGYVLGDYVEADYLAQTIMDWRDADSIPRVHGAERDAYIKADLLVLPTNAPFREVDDLLNVMAMSPEVFALVRPYLRTRGSASVNLNAAPAPVLRALPGMTDATLNRILQLRSQGRRITSIAQVFPGSVAGGQRLPGQAAGNAQAQQLSNQAVLETREVELTITARVGPQAPPTQLIADIGRSGTISNIERKSW